MAQGSTPGGDITSLADALMLNYDLGFRGKVGWSKGALGAMIKKVRWSGLKPVIPIRNTNSPAVSNTFAVAQARAATSTGITKVVQFAPQWYKKFGVAQIDSLLMAAASDDQGAVYDELCTQIDGIMNGVTHQFSTDVYRNGFGAIGRISSTTAIGSTRLILEDPEDSVLFVQGGTYNASLTDHADLLRTSATAVMECAGVEDYEKGYITMTQNLNVGIAAIATGDYIFPEGNRQHSATPVPLAINGLDAWFPVVVPTTTDIASGVDRSKNALFRGTILDYSAAPKNKEDACLDAITASARYGGDPSGMVYFTNNTNYKEILMLGSAKYRPDTTKGPYGISFQGIKIQTDNGEVKVQPDRYCPVKRSYLLDMNTIKFYGCGSAEVPRFIDDDGVGKILRMTDAAAVESRVGWYGTIGCNNPIVNVVVVHRA